MSIDPDRLRARNLEVFRRFVPQVYEQMQPHLDRPRVTEPPARPRFKTSRFNGQFAGRKDMDAQTFAFLSNVLLRANRDDIAFIDKPRTPEAFYVLSIGVPTNAEYQQLLREFRPRCLFIAEPRPEAIADSLGWFDWASNLYGMTTEDREVRLIIDTDPGVAAGNVWRACRRVNPARADNFACVIFDMHDDYGPATVRALTVDLNLVGSHLGFFHDELLMLWNSYFNLTSGKARIYDNRGTEKLDAPVFVVGSGPSLDNDLDFIRENADKAIVVSAGSALRPLLRAGIKPDFQVESENWDVTRKFDQIAGDYDLDGIHLVASATVEQAALERFRDAVLYFRLALSPYPLFSGEPETGMRLPDPTVGNAALCFGLESGFDDIYIFGLDFGAQDKETHHSKESFYYTQEGVSHDTLYDLPVRGNFRDTIWTSKYFLPAVKNASDVIEKLADGRNVINCADGAAIQGARPVRSADVEIVGSADAKQTSLTRLLASFSPADKDIAWDGAALAGSIRAFVQGYRDVLADADRFAEGAYQAPLMSYLELHKGFLEGAGKGPDGAAMMLFRGTILSLVLFAEFYRLRVARPADEKAFYEICRQELIRAVDAMEAHAIHFLAGDTPKEPPPIKDRIAPEGTVLPPLKRLSRNEPCFCGSGKKFKHCHGAGAAAS